MSSIPALASSAQGDKRWLPWIPIAIGFGALYVPTFTGLAQGLWTREEYLHGPIVLAVIAWICWQLRDALVKGDDRPRAIAGFSLLFVGLALYVLGRSQEIIIFEVGSIVPVAAAVLLAMRGRRTLLRFWFPLLFVAFMLPLPGFVVDALTNPLKHHVSLIAEEILYSIGYPIARRGVILNVGPYQLLVADACSGLHSLISMSAMGLLYIYLSRHESVLRNAILVGCLLPIAFAANVIRVIVLVAVTYHFGDEAGQGFIHDFSGVFLFVVGLLFLFAIDGMLGRSTHLADRKMASP